jgi:hypothetical protein
MGSLKGGPRLHAIDLTFKQKYLAKQRTGENLRKITRHKRVSIMSAANTPFI